MTRIDHILMSFTFIQQLQCISILNQQTQSDFNEPQPPQPERKYVTTLENEELWENYSELIQTLFLKSKILTTGPDNHAETDTWVNELVSLINTTVEQHQME